MFKLYVAKLSQYFFLENTYKKRLHPAKGLTKKRERTKGKNQKRAKGQKNLGSRPQKPKIFLKGNWFLINKINEKNPNFGGGLKGNPNGVAKPKVSSFSAITEP